MKTKELAGWVDGITEGDEDLDITGLSGSERSRKGDLTFAVDEANLLLAERSGASCVLVNRSGRMSPKTLIRVNDPKIAFITIFNLLNSTERTVSFVHPTAVVSTTAILGKNIWIGPCVTIGEGVTVGDSTIIEDGVIIKKDCVVGSFCRLYPHVILYEKVILRDHVILHGGVVVGSDGFGYVRDKDTIFKFPQLGSVIIESNVEVGANTTIDRGSLNDTVVGEGTKIDNLCQIAHNVKIGKNVLMAAQCGVSGSTHIGDNVTMGGQVGIVDNISIGDGAIIGAKSAVIGTVKAGSIIWGIPARSISQTKKQMAVLSWITKHFKKISEGIKCPNT